MFGTGTAAIAEVATEAEAPNIVGATALAEVDPLGLKVTAIAIEYDQSFVAAELDQEAAAQAFAVETTLCMTANDCTFENESRTITGGYTASSASVANVAADGNFLVLELSTQDPAASAALFDGTFNAYFDLTESLTFRQLQGLTLGEVTLPAHDSSVVTSASKKMLIDDYEALSLEAKSGVTLPYRKFTPDLVAGEKYPLVLSLHGHGESGTDNLSQVAGNQQSLSFATPERQGSDPSFIISPQTAQGVPFSGDGTGWWDPNWRAAVIQLVEETIAANPQIDQNRVYITGLSMGAFGSWGVLQERSDLFAGAVLVCGMGEAQIALAELTEFPIWVLHSADDIVVDIENPNSGKHIFKAFEEQGIPVTWSEWSGVAPSAEQIAAAQTAWDAAKASDSKHLMTVFPEGTTPVFNHFSWVPTYSNPVILDWLFSQEREPAVSPVTPEITLGSQTVTAGEAVVIAGSGFTANQELTLSLDTDPVVSVQAQADAQGAFQVSLVTPKSVPTGTFKISASVAGQTVASVDLAITAVVVETPEMGNTNTDSDDTDESGGVGDDNSQTQNTPTTSDKDGNLAQTGAGNAILLVGVTGLLLLSGVGLMRARRNAAQ